jgi:thymidylate kinase
MKIAITGPDGAGKSTLCNMLGEHLDDARIVYAGKAYFHLYLTKLSKWLWDAALSVHPLLGFGIQHTIYYPAEYLENMWRIVLCYRKGTTIYDRHVFDRMVMKHSARLRYQQGRIGPLSYWLQYSLNSFWSWVYRNFFPVIDHVFILLPDAGLCFDRANGQYKDLTEASIRVESYQMAYQEVADDARYHLLRVSALDSLDECLRELLNKLDEK